MYCLVENADMTNLSLVGLGFVGLPAQFAVGCLPNFICAGPTSDVFGFNYLHHFRVWISNAAGELV